MKIEEVANTFFKWQPSIFLMEGAQDFGVNGPSLGTAKEGFNESQCNSPKRIASVLR
jgi:hypothetical protein